MTKFKSISLVVPDCVMRPNSNQSWHGAAPGASALGTHQMSWKDSPC